MSRCHQLRTIYQYQLALYLGSLHQGIHRRRAAAIRNTLGGRSTMEAGGCSPGGSAGSPGSTRPQSTRRRATGKQKNIHTNRLISNSRHKSPTPSTSQTATHVNLHLCSRGQVDRQVEHRAAFCAAHHHGLWSKRHGRALEDLVEQRYFVERKRLHLFFLKEQSVVLLLGTISALLVLGIAIRVYLNKHTIRKRRVNEYG